LIDLSKVQSLIKYFGDLSDDEILCAVQAELIRAKNKSRALKPPSTIHYRTDNQEEVYCRIVKSQRDGDTWDYREVTCKNCLRLMYSFAFDMYYFLEGKRPGGGF